MPQLRLERGESGLRHWIDDVPIDCGDIIELKVNGKWVKGRYGAKDLSPNATDPNAFLDTAYLDKSGQIFRLDEQSEVRHPGFITTLKEVCKIKIRKAFRFEKRRFNS